MTTEDVLIPARATERADFITAPKEEAAAVEIGLNAAIVSMIGGEPQILTVSLRGSPPDSAPTLSVRLTDDGSLARKPR